MDSVQSMPPPRYMTPRDYTRKTHGPGEARIATALGRPFMPWQRAAADVAGEVDPLTGRLFYSLVVITVQRQAGKTLSNLAKGVYRSLLTPYGRVWYTAQTGLDARANFLEMARPAELSPLGKLFDLKRASANTAMEFRNGSEFRAHPPTHGSLHGKQGDLNLIDEAWEYTVAQGDALMSGVSPAQSTRNRSPFIGAQTVVLSTRGTADSEWLDGMIEKAREEPRGCLIDFGVPDDQDPTDFDVIARYHPAFGHTMDMASLHTARTQMTNEAEFVRGYANIATGTKDPLLSEAVLDAATTTDTIPESVPFALGAATSYDRSWSAVVAVARLGGRYVAEVIETGPGVIWAAELVDAIAGARRPVGIGVNPDGPSGRLADAITVDTKAPTAREWSTATDDMLARINPGPTEGEPTLLMRHDGGMRRAWRGAVMRNVAEAGRVLSRKHSVGSIAEIEAMLAALWVITHPAAAEPEPMLVTARG